VSLFRWWPAVLATFAFAGCGAEEQPSERPEHVVLVVVDTLRRDHLSIYGAEIETPNIARLAARGAVVENALASFHQTTLSMGALFSGRTPSLESGDPARASPQTGAASRASKLRRTQPAFRTACSRWAR
jgi:hypothetical protein